MKIALIKTKLRAKPSSNTTTTNNDKNTEKPKSQKELVEKKKKKGNSPHNKWSLHNRPPREIRNVIPEPPTQNVPALPQNSSPLVRQHRSHSFNEKTPVTNTTTNTKLNK
jgi:hypothetical protein